jgi:hypothetical protein
MKELTTKQLELLFGERLDSTTFTWDNYCGTIGYSLVDMYDTRQHKDLTFNIKYDCLGWCYANSLAVRTRTNGYAVMLWHKADGVKTWCHISESMAESLLDYKKDY